MSAPDQFKNSMFSDKKKHHVCYLLRLTNLFGAVNLLWTDSILEVQKMIILGGISASWPQNKNLLFESSFVTTTLKNCNGWFFVRRRISEICDIPIGKPLFDDTPPNTWWWDNRRRVKTFLRGWIKMGRNIYRERAMTSWSLFLVNTEYNPKILKLVVDLTFSKVIICFSPGVHLILPRFRLFWEI